MFRPLVIAIAVVFGGGVVAGCGGASLDQVARRESQQFLGDGHPRLIRVEVVRDVSGTREAVVTMQGRFKPPCLTGPCSTRPSSYAVLDFSLGSPGTTWGFWIPTSSQLAAIAQARSTRPLFRIFPDFMNFAVRCSIPRGGRHSGTIAGVCLTDAYSAPTTRVRQVKFLEHWPLAGSRSGNWPSYEKGGGWIVTLGSRGRVRSIRETGHPPPQLWK